jgi:uncharacterized protein (DUF362 family)
MDDLHMRDNGRPTRRECLIRGTGAVVGATLAALGGFLLYDPNGGGGRPLDNGSRTRRLKNFFGDVDFPSASPRLSVTLGEENRIEQMVRAAIGGLDPSLGIKRFVKSGDVVLIKPNVGFDRPPHLGATTHPEVLRWVIRLCREAGAREVVVTDYPIESPAACFARSGIGAVVEAEGAKVILPTESQFQLLEVIPKGDGAAASAHGMPSHWPVLCEPLERAAKLIGIAPVKNHNLASASMVLKNWYGLLGGRRNQLHQAIHAVISDLALLFSPTLVIADATRAMMHNGPTGGRLSDVKPGGELGRPAVIAAVDPVACDAWCYANVLGRDATGLQYLDLASQKIRVQKARGARRFGECDWRAYDRAGQITVTST